jgi:S1-C subfamily serine protease
MSKLFHIFSLCFLPALFAAIAAGHFDSTLLAVSSSFTDVEQPQFVVKVHVHDGSGTGSLVRSDLVLTCHHVIRDSRPGDRIYVEFKNGLERDATVVKVNKDTDLALLRIEPVLLSCAKPANKAAVKNQEVVIGGFPQGNEYAEVRGRVVDFHSYERNGPQVLFSVSNRVASGVSGGPVLNVSGDVVGVLFGSLRFAHCTGLDAIKDFLSDVK